MDNYRNTNIFIKRILMGITWSRSLANTKKLIRKDNTLCHDLNFLIFNNALPFGRGVFSFAHGKYAVDMMKR